MVKKQYVLWGAAVLASGVLGAVALTSAYRSDVQYEINRDAPTLASDTISTISCYLGKLKAEEVLFEAGTSEADPYAVWVDVEACKSAANVANDGATVTQPVYDRLWVKPSIQGGVLRAQVWALTGVGSDERKVYFNAVVRSSATNEYPFGLWEADWCVQRRESTLLYQQGDTCFKKGHIVVSEQGYRLFYDFTGNNGAPFSVASNGIVEAGSTSGAGRYEENRNNDDNLKLAGHFAFGPGALLDDTNGARSCKNPSRNASGVRSSVWQAWLYEDSTGERLAMNGGFPVQNTLTREAGWAGFDGVRLSGTGNPVNNGDFRRVGSSDTYSAFSSFGKLIKITPTRVSGLDSLAGLVLRPRLIETDMLAGVVPAQGEPGLRNSRQKMLMYWDADVDEFVITHRDIGTASAEKFKALTTPIRYTAAQILTKLQTSPQGNQGYRIWAYQMGSNNDYVIHLARQSSGATPLNAQDAYYYKQVQEQVYPGDLGAAETALYCLGRCADVEQVNSQDKVVVKGVWGRPVADVTANPHIYDNRSGGMYVGDLNDPADRSAIDFATAVMDSSLSLAPDAPDVWMDAMVEPSQLSQLSCTVWNGSANVPGYCSYPVSDLADGVQSLSHYYVWNTGNNRWNKFYGLRDAQNQTVRFAEPKVLTYDAPNSPEFGYFAGKKATLRYPGEGRLWLPGRCVNVADSNLPTSAACNNPDASRATHMGMERWIHDFVIPFEETPRGKVTDESGTQYLVKWTRKGTYYPNIDMASCDGLQGRLQQAAQRPLPTLSDWRNPMDPASSAFIGTFADNYPSQYPAPRYVHGVRQ